MPERSVEHAMIKIALKLDASLPRVYAAWTDPEKWDTATENNRDAYQQHEFRVGGRKLQTFGSVDGPSFREEGRYEDIVPNQRIVYSYAVLRDEVRMTVSLQTVELVAEDEGTEFLLTEQITILDGADKAADRENGIRMWLDKFAASLGPS